MSEFDYAPSGSLMLSPDVAAKLHQQLFLYEIAAGRPVNERMLLAVLSELVLTQSEVDPDFQMLANVVMAKALLHDGLPDKQAGRPKGTNYSPEEIAADYFDWVDDGGDPDVVLNRLADDYGLTADYIRDDVIKNAEPWLPSSRAARDQERRTANLLEARWDEKNVALSDAMNSQVCAVDTVAGLERREAKETAQRLLDQAVVKVKGKK